MLLPTMHATTETNFVLTLQAKTVKPFLKELQQSIQKLTTMNSDGKLYLILCRDMDNYYYCQFCSEKYSFFGNACALFLKDSQLNDAEKFYWLPREYLCVLVYLVSLCRRNLYT